VAQREVEVCGLICCSEVVEEGNRRAKPTIAPGFRRVGRVLTRKPSSGSVFWQNVPPQAHGWGAGLGRWVGPLGSVGLGRWAPRGRPRAVRPRAAGGGGERSQHGLL